MGKVRELVKSLIISKGYVKNSKGKGKTLNLLSRRVASSDLFLRDHLGYIIEIVIF